MKKKNVYITSNKVECALRQKNYGTYCQTITKTLINSNEIMDSENKLQLACVDRDE